MKRQRKYHNLENSEGDFFMQRIDRPKFDNTIEAQVRDGETLQALALRFHCTVTEIKRLNKIDKDNEIYARKTIKVPLTLHSALLETITDVHTSGKSSPKRKDEQLNVVETQLNDRNLSEKLLIASVNSSEILQDNSINQIILNSTLKPGNGRQRNGDIREEDVLNDNINEPLLSGVIDESIPQPRPIPLPSKNVFDCSGSDCDISWICLFICVIALCFAIPLIYVFYVAEHLEQFHHGSN